MLKEKMKTKNNQIRCFIFDCAETSNTVISQKYFARNLTKTDEEAPSVNFTFHETSADNIRRKVLLFI